MSSRNNVKINPGALVCVDSILRGEITIGAGTIIHPSVTIIAEAGPIIIGESCLIEEQTKIIHRLPLGQVVEPGAEPPVMVIGSHNVFEVDSAVESPRVGDNNVFENKCYVGSRVIVTDGCVVGAGCRITAPQTLCENTVVYGADCRQRVALNRPPLQTLQLEILASVLRNFHNYQRTHKKN